MISSQDIPLQGFNLSDFRTVNRS